MVVKGHAGIKKFRGREHRRYGDCDQGHLRQEQGHCHPPEGTAKGGRGYEQSKEPAVRKDRMNQLLTNDPEVKAFDNLPAEEQAKINAGRSSVLER